MDSNTRTVNLHVVAWTVNEREAMRAMIAADVEDIMTDFPDRLRATIEDAVASA